MKYLIFDADAIAGFGDDEDIFEDSDAEAIHTAKQYACNTGEKQYLYKRIGVVEVKRSITSTKFVRD